MIWWFYSERINIQHVQIADYTDNHYNGDENYPTDVLFSFFVIQIL
jgi:hypothetical protein